ncbi:hypothetical protein KIW84_061049 [Lathyrus oleraceus]|uniref:Uncharacterized protein n=1 Tax=Pisum sativum TaxID=3888 RepID=A0A9D4W4K8_PEA|nr:hypothetical protein KIW84_061049 [Pisum sativum]
MSHSEIKVVNSSNLLDEKFEVGEMCKDMDQINDGMIMEDKKKKILPMKIVNLEKKTEVLRLDHMSQHHAQHVEPRHRKNKKQTLIYHHCEKDDQVHEDVEANATISKDDGMDNHDQTLIEGMISKNESNILVYSTNRKEYKLLTQCTLSIKDKFTLIEENFNVEQVDVVKSINSMIFATEDRNVNDCLSLLGTIILCPRSEPRNEGVTKEADLGNISLLNEDIVLKNFVQ